jgi:hypothetical protein
VGWWRRRRSSTRRRGTRRTARRRAAPWRPSRPSCPARNPKLLKIDPFLVPVTDALRFLCCSAPGKRCGGRTWTATWKKLFRAGGRRQQDAELANAEM